METVRFLDVRFDPRPLVTAALAVLLAVAPAIAGDSPTYTFQTVDPPGSTNTFVAGINDSGAVVGRHRTADGVYHGFLYDGETYTILDYPGADNTFAYDITFDSACASCGFVIRKGKTTQVRVPGSSCAQAADVNDRGDIGGSYWDNPGCFVMPLETWHGFVLRSGTFTTVDVPGASHTEVSGINAAGEIVGAYIAAGGGASDQHGFFLDGAAFTTIDVPGAQTTAILDINARGDIVGYFRDGTGSHGFIGRRN
jgi:probable HAF family extracellular repeat protein